MLDCPAGATAVNQRVPASAKKSDISNSTVPAETLPDRGAMILIN